MLGNMDDGESVIHLTKNQILNKMTKYINVKMHIIRCDYSWRHYSAKILIVDDLTNMMTNLILIVK